MNDSLRGVLIVLTVAGLFVTAILNFIVLFPQEQGIVFTDNPSADDYLTMGAVDTNTQESLNSINGNTTEAFNEWDITTGFMGTNQLKQGQGEVKTTATSLFSNLDTIATQLFGANSPIVYTIGIIGLLTAGYITYLIIKFVRTGN